MSEHSAAGRPGFDFRGRPIPPAENGEPRARRAVAREVAQFNDLIPVGSRVLYWPALREGPGVASKTRTRAWLLGDHTPVVMVEGYPGGIALSHVCPIPPGPCIAD